MTVTTAEAAKRLGLGNDDNRDEKVRAARKLFGIKEEDARDSTRQEREAFSKMDLIRRQYSKTSEPLKPITREGTDSLLIPHYIFESLGMPLGPEELDEFKFRPEISSVGRNFFNPIRDRRVFGILPTALRGKNAAFDIASDVSLIDGGPVKGAAWQFLMDRWIQNQKDFPNTDPRLQLPGANISDYMAFGAGLIEAPPMIIEAFGALLGQVLRDVVQGAIKTTNFLASLAEGTNLGLPPGHEAARTPELARAIREKGGYLLPENYDELAEQWPFLEVLLGQRDVDTFEDVGKAESIEIMDIWNAEKGFRPSAGLPGKHGDTTAQMSPAAPLPQRKKDTSSNMLKGFRAVAEGEIPRILGSEALAGIAEFVVFPAREALLFYAAFTPDPRIEDDVRRYAIGMMLETGFTGPILAAMALRGGSTVMAKHMEARLRRGKFETTAEALRRIELEQDVIRQEGKGHKFEFEKTPQEILEDLTEAEIQQNVDALLKGEKIEDVPRGEGRNVRGAVETWFSEEMRAWLHSNFDGVFTELTIADYVKQLDNMNVYDLVREYNATRYGNEIMDFAMKTTRPNQGGVRTPITVRLDANEYRPTGSAMIRLQSTTGMSADQASGLIDHTKDAAALAEELVAQRTFGSQELRESALNATTRLLVDHQLGIDAAKVALEHEGITSKGAELLLKDQITAKEALESHLEETAKENKQQQSHSKEEYDSWPEEIRDTFDEMQEQSRRDANRRIREIIENSEASRPLVVPLGDPLVTVTDLIKSADAEGNVVATGQLLRSKTPVSADWTRVSEPVSAKTIADLFKTKFGGLPIKMSGKFHADFRADKGLLGFFSFAEEIRGRGATGHPKISEDLIALRAGFSDVGSMVHEVAHFIDRWFVDFSNRNMMVGGGAGGGSPFKIDKTKMTKFNPTDVAKTIPGGTSAALVAREGGGAKFEVTSIASGELVSLTPAQLRWLELKGMDYDAGRGFVTEGWAEFVRLWMESDSKLLEPARGGETFLDQHNRYYAPEMVKWWENVFLPKNPWLSDIMYEARELTTAYAWQGDLWRFDQRVMRETRKRGFIQKTRDFVETAKSLKLTKEAIAAKLRLTGSVGQDLITMFSNDWHPIYQYERATTGKGVLPTQLADISPSRLADVITRVSQAKAYSAVFDGPRDFGLQPWLDSQGNKIRALADIVRGITSYPDGKAITYRPNNKVRVDGRDMKLVDAMVNYGIAKSILERINNEQRFTDIVAREAQQWVDKAPRIHPDIPEVARQVTEWGDAILRYYADAGGLGPSEYNAIKQANSSWFYLKRVLDEAGPTGSSALGTLGRGLQVLGTPLKRAFGSDKPIIDPMESFANYAQQMISAADRIRTARSLLQMRDKLASQGERVHGGGKLLHEIDLPPIVFPSTIKNVKAAFLKGLKDADRPDIAKMISDLFKFLQEEGHNLTPEEASRVVNLYMQSPKYLGKDNPNIINIFDKGKLRAYEVDPALMEVFRGTEAPLHSSLMVMMGGPTRLVRLGATGLRASFTLANIWRDALTFAIHSEHAKTPLPLFKSYLDMFSNSENFKQFKSAGLEFSGMVGFDRATHLELIDRMMADTGWRKTRAAFRHPIDAIRFIMAKPELPPRLAEFRLKMERLPKEFPEMDPKAPGLSPREVRRRRNALAVEAIRGASDVTVNFRRSGTLGFYLNQIYAFWNAATQGATVHGRKLGLENTLKALNEPVPAGSRRSILRGGDKLSRSVALRAMAYITLPAIGLYFENRDKPWFQKLADWEKYGFFHLDLHDWLGSTWEDGSPMRIQLPYPFEIGYIWGAMPVMFMDKMSKIDGSKVERMWKQFQRSVLPSTVSVGGVLPAAFKPLFENYANVSVFLDRPLYSHYKAPNQFAQNQFYPWTQEWAKFTAKTANELSQLKRGDLTSQLINIAPWQLENLLYGYTGGFGTDLSRGIETLMDVDQDPESQKRGFFSRFSIREKSDDQFMTGLRRQQESEKRKWQDVQARLFNAREAAYSKGQDGVAREINKEIAKTQVFINDATAWAPAWHGLSREARAKLEKGPISQYIKALTGR